MNLWLIGMGIVYFSAYIMWLFRSPNKVQKYTQADLYRFTTVSLLLAATFTVLLIGIAEHLNYAYK